MNDIFVLPLTNSDKVCIIDTDKASQLSKFNFYLSHYGYVHFTCEQEAALAYNKAAIRLLGINAVLNQLGEPQ